MNGIDRGVLVSVNGTPTRVFGAEDKSAMEIIGSALRQTRTPFRDCLDWELRDEKGALYPHFKRLGKTVQPLFVNMKPGIFA